jgi:transposase
MLNIAAAPIHFFGGPTDMRKSFNGLSGLVVNSFEEPLTSGAFFLFVNRRRTMLKVLYWDQDGLALWCKRLERGTFRVRWDGGTNMSRREFSLLLEGVTPRRMNKRYKIGE